jgi:hypothetical protein
LVGVAPKLFFAKLGSYGLGSLTAGTLINTASGATVGYAGGMGNGQSILSSALQAAGSGLYTEAALTAIGFGWAQLPGKEIITETSYLMSSTNQIESFTSSTTVSYSSLSNLIQGIAASTVSPELFIDQNEIRQAVR